MQFDNIIEGSKDTYCHPKSGWDKDIAKRVICQDGITISVQASRTHYCTPREDQGPYTHVEIGYPSVSPGSTWAKYYDGNWTPDNACGSVYGYVPIELVREFVEAHGGEIEPDATTTS